MAETTVSTPPPLRITPAYVLRTLGSAVLILAVILTAMFRGDLNAMRHYGGAFMSAYARPHALDPAPLLAAGPAVWIHVATVLGAFAVGTILILGVKGTRMHRVLGWAWASFMLIAAAASLFIRGINPNGLSILHGFSLYVLVAAPLAVWFARRGRIDLHGRMMAGIYFGALIIAGASSFLPGRVMWRLFFS